MDQSFTVVLRDVLGDHGRQMAVTIHANELGIGINFTGYGDACSASGHGEPVLIENREGVPHVVVWSDISSEDPTHTVSLKGAAEK